MHKYKCLDCPYVYDPSQNNNIEFKNLPSDWTCPICKSGKERFEIIHQLGEAQTGGEAQEKHVPIITAEGNNTKVIVGAITHPMNEDHYITLIELFDGTKLLKSIQLASNQTPEAIFENIIFKNNYSAIAHCNLHGMWESK